MNVTANAPVLNNLLSNFMTVLRAQTHWSIEATSPDVVYLIIVE